MSKFTSNDDTKRAFNYYQPQLVLDTEIRKFKIIQGNRINLELLLNEDDHKNLLVMCQENYKSGHIQSFFRESVVDMDLVKFYVDSYLEDNQLNYPNATVLEGINYLIKLKTGQIIGILQLYSDAEGLAFGLFIDKKHSGQNYGTEAVQTAIKFVKKHTQAQMLVWGCDINNVGSATVAKKCGFVHVGDVNDEDNHVQSVFYLSLF
ncbi:ribosomal-protein-alanine n-acetyltransferase [Tupanvirus deep ocean]|uniref:Ribosomal-protein-alanine n-acetyltransferase n=2 Tax=Tupanvirus TaxID=2094720 RepID=A0AC62A9P9_9VIRU|nr:ribosomal-protein-alanine n-acetyltransferase [Tupanvirus deep ocean]QKU34449.1 ribosomal-protein-alanine n-acetyltransferase [Tupanvirus deep ocean]